MKHLILILLAALLCTACNTKTSEETELDTSIFEQISDEQIDSLMNQVSLNNQYSLFWQLRAEVQDDAHNTKSDIPYVTFPGNAELTEAVNTALFLPMMQIYNAYVDSPADPANFLTIDACVYESEEFLGMACMSVQQGTVQTMPEVISVIVDLETEKILSPADLLARYDRTADAVLTDAKAIYAAEHPENTGVVIEEIVTAYLDADGDRVFVLSYTDTVSDISEGIFFYNDTDNALCTASEQTQTFASVAY